VNKKMFTIFSLLLISCLGLNVAFAAHAMANRELCNPQNADMSQISGTFTTTCHWSKWMPGSDTNAQITLNGKQTVHAECEFSGPDSVAFVMGYKHAGFDELMMPGNKFSFDVKYKEYADSTDDNQNVMIYLNKAKPDATDTLTCQFTVK